MTSTTPKLRPRRVLALAALVLPALVHAGSFQPYLKLDGRAAYASVTNDDSSWLAIGSFTAVPAWKPLDKLVLLPVFSATSAAKDRTVGEEDPFVSKVLFLTKPTAKAPLGAWEPRAWGVAKRAVTKEVQGGVWSAGRYDHEEFGAGAGLEYKPGLGTLVGPLGLGLEWHHRNYMNFHALQARITGNRNYYYKDYDGWKVELDADTGKGIPILKSLGYTLLFKNYTDSLLLKKSDKTYDLGSQRSDQLHKLKLDLEHHFGKTLHLMGALSLDLNQSNSNFYDPTWNVFVDDYDSYSAATLVAALVWLLKEAKDAPSLTLAYRGESRTYRGRPIRNPNGAYTAGTQAEMDHTASLDGRYPMFWQMALVGGASFRSVQSNQGYSPGIKPTFDLFVASLGLEFKL